MKQFFKGIEKIFIWSSGASPYILDQVPMEKSKYFGIGGTILFTALMATLAGGYAFYTAFQDTGMAVGFGIFWGCLIFNIDRYIVSSFGVGDGKKTISLQELKEGAPRILMAIILGIVISTPLELKLFEKEIEVKISENINVSQSSSAQRASSDPVLNNLVIQRDKLINNGRHRDSILQTKLNQAQKAAQDKNDELYHGKFSGKAGKGDTYNSLKQLADAAQSTYNADFALDQTSDASDIDQIKLLDSTIVARRQEVSNNLGGVNAKQSENNGFLARIKALGDLTKENNTVFAAKWLITLLLIFIEIAPILFKMLTERGPYDDILDRIKYEIKVRQMELQSNLNQEINTAVKVHTAKYEEKLNVELGTNKEILEAVAKAQQEIALIAIRKWKEEQKLKMAEANVHEMVNSN